MILITHPETAPNEISLIHQFFECGLTLLHIRKPDFSEEQMKDFINAIGREFNDRLVLHQHHHLGKELNIDKFHFSAKERFAGNTQFNEYFLYSTSVHSIEEFNELPDSFDYAFLSPVFQSISKPGYQSNENLLKAVKKRTNFKTILIGLGGISDQNSNECLENGFDDIALLGSIWNSKEPLKQFKKCQENALMY